MSKYEPLKLEPKILKFWQQNKIYEKQKAKGKNGKKFYFLQGPPYTSGKMHLGHAWNYSLKDPVLRYKRMQGFNVWDRGGWDMQGLPTANKIQAKLGLKHKADIEKYGVGKFVAECKKYSLKQKEVMTKNLISWGVWLDHKNAYLPVTDEFIEGVWACIKESNRKSLLYEAKKTMTWCGHCGTGLAKHELEYNNVNDKSIFLKFKIRGEDDKYLIIWTTTPWTIPLNLAVMVNPDIEYSYVRVHLNGKDETWVIARPLVNVFLGMLGIPYKIIETIKGEQLKGLSYEHPLENDLPILKELRKKYKWAFKVILSDKYVDASAGSGLVHCAPGCGPEDYEVGLAHGLPPFNELDHHGRFSDKMGKYKSWIAKVDDARFIKDLEESGSLITTTQVEHEYPHCWRCHNPVIFRATKQWFFGVEKVKKTLHNWNKSVNWTPDWAGSRAFNSWIDNLKDIVVTRQRYWGTPIPIWRCDSCKDYTVVGSKDELKKLAGKLPKELHKPWIDEITFSCKKCKTGTKMRVPDICDVWLDAGCTSWISLYYPQRKDLFKKYWPADFICEGKDQIRGWFNLLFNAAELYLDKQPFKNCYMHGFINDSQGRKMSKSLSNTISPEEITTKYGADTMRYYMMGAAQPGLDMNYNFSDISLKYRNLGVLWNTVHYLLGAAKLAKVNPTKIKSTKFSELDKYILSRANSTLKSVTEKFESYHLNEISWLIEELYLDLSRWYIQSVRERASQKEVLYIMYEVLLNCLKMLAPVAPFITEELYQKMKKQFKLKEVSIHLFDWPKYNSKQINSNLESEMEIVKDITSTLLSGREKIQRGKRWPISLAVAVVTGKKASAVKKHEDLIKEMTNVWELKISNKIPSAVERTIKVDFRQINPKFGEDAPKIVAKIIQKSERGLLQELASKKKITLTLDKRKQVELVREDLIIEKILPNDLINIEGAGYDLYIDTNETEAMITSGFVREIARKVQSLRRDAGLVKSNKINLELIVPPDMIPKLDNYIDELKERVGASSIKFVARTKKKFKASFAIRGKKISIGF